MVLAGRPPPGRRGVRRGLQLSSGTVEHAARPRGIGHRSTRRRGGGRLALPSLAAGVPGGLLGRARCAAGQSRLRRGPRQPALGHGAWRLRRVAATPGTPERCQAPHRLRAGSRHLPRRGRSARQSLSVVSRARVAADPPGWTHRPRAAVGRPHRFRRRRPSPPRVRPQRG